MPESPIEDYLPHQYPPIFDLNHTTQTKIASSIDNLSSSPSSSCDGITLYMLKSGKMELLPIFEFIFNLSIDNKLFPTLWKTAKVTPLFKAGDATSPNKYRPISVLPSIGKLLERIIYDQLYSYLTSNQLLSQSQSGFGKGYSMGTCLVDFLHNIYEEINEGGACGVLFLDLSKAFDTVNHEVIKIKLKALGIKESSLDWFVCYLSGRSQSMCVDGHFSDPGPTNSGVPQESILGPLLFVCYVNDMPQYCNRMRPFLFADDTALLIKDNSLENIQNQLQNDFNRLLLWFSANKLSLNVKKTKSMLICHRRSPYRNFSLSIHGNNTPIEPVDTIKYLGLYID